MDFGADISEFESQLTSYAVLGRSTAPSSLYLEAISVLQSCGKG